MRKRDLKNETVLEYLTQRSLLKQDVFEVSKKSFSLFKERLEKKITDFLSQSKSDRVRLKYDEKGDFESHAFVGSDLLIFNMHTNVFCFPPEHSIWKTSYVEKDRDLAYCGVIHIYNFLSDSFLQGRLNDSGYLLGRIYINKENHFFIEGKGELGFRYRDFINAEFTEQVMDEVIDSAICHAAEFDLLTPPAEMISTVSVQQMQVYSSSLQLKTAKRLGFRFNADSEKLV